jgi:hypothetical protein
LVGDTAHAESGDQALPALVTNPDETTPKGGRVEIETSAAKLPAQWFQNAAGSKPSLTLFSLVSRTA